MWSAVGVGAHGIGQFVLLAVLGRYLTKIEFGIVSATLIQIAFARALLYAIVPALVQIQTVTRAHIETAFALTVWYSVGIGTLLWFGAPSIEAFFEIPRLAPVLRVLTVAFFLEAFGLVPQGLLHRDLELKGLAIAESASFLLGYLALGVACAMFGLGVWSLVAANVGQVVVKTGVLLFMRNHPRSLRFQRSALRDIARFSGGHSIARLFNASAAQADNFVVARWMTADALGVYGRAYQLMSMPAMYFGQVLDRLLFPKMSRLQDDLPRLGEAYARSVSAIATLAAPAAVAGMCLGPEIVRLALGPGWEEVVLPFRVLAAGLLFRTGYKVSDSLANASGRVYGRAWRQAVFALAVFLGALGGVKWGVVGVASGIVLALAVNYTVMARLSLSIVGMCWRQYIPLHGRGLLLAAATYPLVMWPAQACRAAGYEALVVSLLSLLPATLVLGALLAWRPQSLLGVEGLRFWQRLRRGGPA